MPFTPFHLGPALGFGLPLRRYIHVPTFLVANVLVDVEPFFVLLLQLGYPQLDYPLHGYLHTFGLASILGLALGYVMFLLEAPLGSLYKAFLLESSAAPKLKSFIAAGVLGTMLHVLLDSPLYYDIRPFYPSSANPLLHSFSSSEVYSFCVLMGVFGVVFYLGLLLFLVYVRLRKKRSRGCPSLQALFRGIISRYRKKPIKTKQATRVAARRPASTPI
jgi:membrane-bound metal-dependent hydrolase YbcI (DUF457 family)